MDTFTKEIDVQSISSDLLAKQIPNGFICQLTMRGARKEIERAAASEGIKSPVKAISSEISQLQLFAKDLARLRINVLSLICRYPLLKCCGFIEAAGGDVYVYYSESGCNGITQCRRLNVFYERHSDGGSGRWPESSSACEPINTRFLNMQTGTYVHVYYTFPFKELWDRCDFAIERNGKFYVDPEKSKLCFLNGKYVSQDEADLAFFKIEDGVLTEYSGAAEAVDIPKDVKAIGRSAFIGNQTVRYIRIPEGCLEIGEWAFRFCSGLEELMIPDSVKKIHISALSDCKIRMLRLPAALEELVTDGGFSSRQEKIVVPEGCAHFITIDGVLLNKERTAAYFCNKDIQGKYVMPETVTTVAENCFSHAKRLEEVELSPRLRSIPETAFSECETLRSIVLPPQLEEIKCMALWHCDSLQDVHVPESVKEIGKDAFEGVKGPIYIHGADTKLNNCGFSPWVKLAILKQPLETVKWKPQALMGICLALEEGYPVSDDIVAGYVRYLKRQKKHLFDTIRISRPLLLFMDKHGLLTVEDLETLKKHPHSMHPDPDLLQLIDDLLSRITESVAP